MLDTWDLATLDNRLYSALHGTAWRRAVEQRSLAEAIADLNQLARRPQRHWCPGRRHNSRLLVGLTDGLGRARAGRRRNANYGRRPSPTATS